MSKDLINKITIEFSKKWLNRKGIWGIVNKSHGKENNIVLYVNLDEIDYDELPKQFKGIKTMVRPVSKFEAQAITE